jgi:hypothetical protein
VCKCKSLHSQMQDMFKSGGCRRLLPLAKTSQMELFCSRQWSITQTPSAHHTNISRNYMSNPAYLNKSASTPSSESLQPPFRLPRMKTICSPRLKPSLFLSLENTLPQMDQLRSLAQVVTCMESKRTAAFAMRGYTLQTYSSQKKRRDSLDSMCDRSILVAHIASLHV